MTKEQIEKELSTSPPLRGQILCDGKLLGAFDSEKRGFGHPAQAFGEDLLATSVCTSRNPRITVVVSRGGDPKRIQLVRMGRADAKISMGYVRAPEDASRYILHFDRPLPPGEYEFAVTKGTLLIFLRCGVSVPK
jgi:hypothetical protein